MKHFLFFDTETTDMVDWKAPPQAPSQPWIIQLAALLTDRDGNELEKLNTLIRLPEDVRVAPEAFKTHGISWADANEQGIPLWQALWTFDRMLGKADMLIAHNIDFDMLIMRAAHAKIGYMHRLRDPKPFCTMKNSTNLCKVPGPRGFKWPKLIEAHKHFLGCEFDGAHDALADVSACSRVFFAMPTDITGLG